MKKLSSPAKLSKRREGPHCVSKVHVNGKNRIELRPGVTKCLKICRVNPCHRPAVDKHPPISGQEAAVEIERHFRSQRGRV